MSESDDKYIGYETLEDWIYDAEINVQLEEKYIQSLIDTHEYQTEEKLGKAFYKDIFKSKHHEVNERKKRLNWYKQLLGFFTELKQLREEKENERV